MKPLARVDTVPLFPPLHQELVALLGGLSPEAWEHPATARWRVRDVAAHLLDGDLRKLSLGRDRHRITPPAAAFQSERGLVEWLNQLNAEWVTAAERLSPAILVELLAFTGPQVSAYFASLDPDAPAPYPVAWAGESESANWMDVGREYTERWHHQQQIRGAVGEPGLSAPRWLRPVLDLSVRALVVGWSGVDAEDGTAVVFEIAGESGGAWSLVREGGTWRIYEGAAPDPACTVATDEDTAWRVFLHAIPPERAAERVEIRGERRLGEPFVHTRAVMV